MGSPDVDIAGYTGPNHLEHDQFRGNPRRAQRHHDDLGGPRGYRVRPARVLLVGRRPDVHRALSAQFVPARRDVRTQLLQSHRGNPPCTATTYQVSSGGTFTGLGLFNDARSKHPGGVNVGMCDGSVRFIKNSVNIYHLPADRLQPRVARSSAGLLLNKPLARRDSWSSREGKAPAEPAFDPAWTEFCLPEPKSIPPISPTTLPVRASFSSSRLILRKAGREREARPTGRRSC